MPVLANQRHEQFCQFVSLGYSDTEAYASVYGMDAKDANANAWRVRVNDGVTSRIRELQGKIAEKRVLTAAQRREWLHDLVTTPVSKIDDSSPLCNGSKYDAQGNRVFLIPDKVAALKLDAQLAGELDNRSTVDVRLSVFQVDSEKPILDLPQAVEVERLTP